MQQIPGQPRAPDHHHRGDNRATARISRAGRTVKQRQAGDAHGPADVDDTGVTQAQVP